MSAQNSFILSQFMRLTDRRTDISLMAKTALHRCSAVMDSRWRSLNCCAVASLERKGRTALGDTIQGGGRDTRLKKKLWAAFRKNTGQTTSESGSCDDSWKTLSLFITLQRAMTPWPFDTNPIDATVVTWAILVRRLDPRCQNRKSDLYTWFSKVIPWRIAEWLLAFSLRR